MVISAPPNPPPPYKPTGTFGLALSLACGREREVSYCTSCACPSLTHMCSHGQMETISTQCYDHYSDITAGLWLF